jgi:hypothetical protein
MSYEGVEEFICNKGHYWTLDAGVLHYDFLDNMRIMEKVACPHCKETPAYTCSVDETNGYDPNLPCTFHGPKIEIGYEDIEMQDHHGNKYFVKLERYKPDNSTNRWRKEGD